MFRCDGCGKVFNNVKALNGHKATCKSYHLFKYGNLNKYNLQINNLKKVRTKYCNVNEDIWLSEQHKCEKCGKIMTEYYGSGRFCSRKCANTRNLSEYTRQAIKDSLCKTFESCYNENPNYCMVCGNKIPYKLGKRRKTCSDKCLNIIKKQSQMTGGHVAGLKNAYTQQRRSKNEIAFCDMCEKYFGVNNVLHNEPIFNGWDADVILPQYKLAILWNGPWHYRKITKQHSLKQVQNRDKIKIKEIRACGYTEYIIKDIDKCKDIVDKEFNKLLNFLDIH